MEITLYDYKGVTRDDRFVPIQLASERRVV